MTVRAQLIAAARGSVGLRLISFAFTLAGSVLLARALGPAGYGVYSYAFAIIALLLIPSQLGITSLLVRETAKAETRQDWSGLKGLWGWATRVIACASIFVALVAASVIWWNSERIGAELVLTLAFGLALLPLISLGDARGATLRGLRLIVRGQLPEAVIRPVLLVAFVGGFWLLNGRVSASAAMGLHAVAAAITFLIGATILWHARPPGLAACRPDQAMAPQWVRATLPLALMSGMLLVNQQAGVILLGLFRPEMEVGQFKVAASASTLALFGLQTVTLVVAPFMARMHSSGELDALQRLTSLGAAISSAMTLPVLLVFILGGRQLIGLMYGSEYVDAWAPLVILVLGQAVNVLFGPAALLLNMSGHEQTAARWLGVSTVLNVVLGLVLIPPFGMVGAAIATSISLGIWSAASWHVSRRKVGVDGGLVAAIRLLYAGQLASRKPAT
jgi:O-antigen/teichoic acid export membrane protein